jgi:saccharopine dehydrogenase (NAD+, L-lysine-forming)
MTHLWLRAEQRPHEQRVGLTPEGAAELVGQGIKLTVEESPDRILPIDAYRAIGCEIAPFAAWPDAPDDAFIFGLKEIPDDGTPLRHRHIMFGHAFKGQPSGQILLKRFKAGGGVLYDLEYLVDDLGRRVAAFGYWAGYAGAAVSVKCWIAQRMGGIAGPVGAYGQSERLLDELKVSLAPHLAAKPRAMVIGALGRVGTGASDLCEALGIPVTKWDMAETDHGGPFPEVLDHDIFLNCILARPGTPVFVPATAGASPRRLTVIGDIACDPTSAFSPIQVYDKVTDWDAPALRVHDEPPLDVTAIDNLPSMLPRESSEDFAAQLLPSLKSIGTIDQGVWGRARAEFEAHVATV